MPIRTEGVPGTIRRSPEKVRRTYRETLDSAHQQYSSEERAHRAAWASVKHVAEKVGDHWEEKDEYGPSDPQSEQHGAAARDHPKATYGGVDENGAIEPPLVGQLELSAMARKRTLGQSSNS